MKRLLPAPGVLASTARSAQPLPSIAFPYSRLQRIVLLAILLLTYVYGNANTCADAISVACGTNETGSTVGEPHTAFGYCGTSDGSAGMQWYTFAGDGNSWTFETVSTSGQYDTKIWVFRGSCGSLTCVTGNDDGGSGTLSRVTFTANAAYTYYVIVGGYNTAEGNYDLDISSTPCNPNMAYSSSTAFINNTSDASICGSDHEIIGVEVVTTGTLSPFDLTSLRLRTNGSTAPTTDISGIDIYYTGTSNTFATTTLFGSAAPAASGTNIDVAGTQTLSSGSNYFWVVYNLTGAATIGNTIDARCTRVTVNGTNYTPTVTAPSGSRDIGVCVPDGPGGVDTELQLWLRADVGTLNGGSAATDGQSLNTWQDQSGQRTNDATDANLSAPTYRNNANDNLNYNPVVDFDGTDDGLDFGSDYLYSSGTGTQDGMTFFAVVEPDATSGKTRQYLLDFGFFADRGYGIIGGSERYGMYSAMDYGGTETLQTHTHGATPILLRYEIDFGASQSFYVNGSSSASYSAGITLNALSASEVDAASAMGFSSGPVTIGHQAKSQFAGNEGGRRFDGSIAELVAFRHVLSDAAADETDRVESYLAMKYGLTLSNQGGGVEGDYTAADGTTIWDASNSGTHHNDVLAIGREDVSGFYQRQSTTSDDSLQIYVSTLQGNNSGNAGTISNDASYIMIGRDQGRLNNQASTDRPSNVYARWERTWKITNTNFTDSYNIRFEWDSTGTFDLNDLCLLVDDDGNFSNATAYSAADGLSFTQGSLIVSGISTSHIPANSTRFITIGSVNPDTPLPVALLEFTAKPTPEQHVKLAWQTASEFNSDFFTVQRSSNGHQWESIATVKGAGNSTQALQYGIWDSAPLQGVSYYRLKQTDFDGSVEYCPMRALQIGARTAQVVAYPNPFSGHLTLQHLPQSEAPYTITVHDVQGREVHRQQLVAIGGIAQLRVPGHLQRGVFAATIVGNGVHQTLRLVKK